MSPRLKAIEKIIEQESMLANQKNLSPNGAYINPAAMAYNDYLESKGLRYDEESDSYIDKMGNSYSSASDFLAKTEPENNELLADYLQGILTQSNPEEYKYLENQNKLRLTEQKELPTEIKESEVKETEFDQPLERFLYQEKTPTIFNNVISEDIKQPEELSDLSLFKRISEKTRRRLGALQ